LEGEKKAREREKNKMAKRTSGENPQDLYITIVKKKNDLFEYTS
jgi:hypothetical protein